MLARSPALVFSALVAGVLLGACRRDAPSKTPEPAAAPPTTPEVIEWLLGEQTRGPRASNRGTNLGILTLDIATDAKAGPGTPRPQTCASGLVAFIPLPTRSGDWFGLDESGSLLRHSPDGWQPVPVSQPVPALTTLVAITGAPPRFELLVTLTKDHREHLAVLVIVNGQITGIQGVDLSALPDRRTTLQRYDSGRCVAGTRDCLHVTPLDEGAVLMREPELFGDRVEVTTFEEGTVRDVRYADAKGTKVDVLSPRACEAAPAPGGPSQQPEALP
jgi:hypothetical protein